MVIDRRIFNIETDYINNDDELLLQELESACKMQFPEYNGTINQKTINSWIKNELLKYKWKAEYTCPYGQNERFDFYKKSKDKDIYVEVEYGNRFSVDHDYLKFMKTFQLKKDSLFVLIVPHKTMNIKKSMATFEYSCSLIETCKCIVAPIVLIGIQENSKNDVINLNEILCEGQDKKEQLKHLRGGISGVYFEG